LFGNCLFMGILFYRKQKLNPKGLMVMTNIYGIKKPISTIGFFKLTQTKNVSLY